MISHEGDVRKFARTPQMRSTHDVWMDCKHLCSDVFLKNLNQRFSNYGACTTGGA